MAMQTTIGTLSFELPARRPAFQPFELLIYLCIGLSLSLIVFSVMLNFRFGYRLAEADGDGGSTAALPPARMRSRECFPS